MAFLFQKITPEEVMYMWGGLAGALGVRKWALKWRFSQEDEKVLLPTGRGGERDWCEQTRFQRVGPELL